MKGKSLFIIVVVFLGMAFISSANAMQPKDGEAKKVENRWYSFSDGRDAKGYLHIQKTLDPKRKNEVLLTVEFIATWRGKIVSMSLKETCKDDQYLTLQRIVSSGQGDDEFGNFDAKIRWTEEGLGELVTTRNNRPIKRSLPRGTVGSFTLFELVQRLPFKEGEVFAFHSLEESELNLKKDHKLTYKGKESIALGDESVELHLFEQTSKRGRFCLYWLTDDHLLIRVLMDGQTEFLLADDDAARAGAAVLRLKLDKVSKSQDPKTPTPAPSPESPNAIPAQARPVADWFKAIKQADVQLLKSAFSKRMREDLEKKGWEKKLQDDKGDFAEAFGEYAASDFSYTYEGGETAGKVKIVHKGHSTGTLDVVFEDGAWRIDEW